MNTLQINFNSGNTKTYKLIEGNKSMPIAYSIDTDDKLVKILESCRKQKIRVVLDYGDVKTNKSWGEVCDIEGYVGLSKGYQAYFPILVYNTRSLGGGSILDNCIISIKTTKGKQILYKQS